MSSYEQTGDGDRTALIRQDKHPASCSHLAAAGTARGQNSVALGAKVWQRMNVYS